MQMRRLGQTELVVSRASFGGLFVASFATEFEEAARAVQRGLELGINYFDTAPSYGDSEEVLGRALAGIQAPYHLSTKLGGRPQPFDPKNKEHLWSSLQESLRLLKRDVIDILFVHEPDRPRQYDWFDDWDTFHGPVCEFLQDAKDRGLIRYTGLGGTTAYEMARIIEKGNYDVVLTAFNYSLLWREAAIAILPAAKRKGMGIIAGSPLQQGWLARRYDEVLQHNPPAWLSPPRREQLLRLYAYVDRLGLSLPEVGVRFVLSNPDIDVMLMGLRSVQELEHNVRAVEAGPLPDDVLTELEDIARMVPFRPFQEPFGCMLGRTNYRGPGVAG